MDTTLPQSKSILVVDDDHSICEVLRIAFKREGFNVIISQNGEKALDLLKGRLKKIDLVILDLMMPGLGGYDVLKELQNEGYQEVPVYVITGRAMDGTAISMIKLESNVVEFLQKPIEIQPLVEKIHNALGTIPRKQKGWQWDTK